MFKSNEQKYGVQSTYKPNLEGYTVQLKTAPNSEEFRKMEAKASAKAEEIQGFKTIDQINQMGDQTFEPTFDTTANFADQTSAFIDDR